MAETGNQRNLTKGEKTKYRLARAMKECMKTTSVENITVKQITEKCELTRQTFYRNFLDKYDLINWYFDKLLAKSFEHMGQGKTVYDALVKKFTYIQEEQKFFSAAFRYDEQNSLRQHDFELILAFYEKVCRLSTRLPGATWITGKPDWKKMVFYYATVCVILFVMKQLKRRTGFVFTGSILLLLVLYNPVKGFELDILDVGQGDGIYLCTGGGTSMFIDGGSTDVKQVGKYRILPFLKAKGVSEISYWFVSHTDTDHVSGLKEVLVSGYRVEYLVFAKAVEKEAKTKELAELARSHGTKVLYMQAGDTVRSKRAAMRCLYPKASDKAEDVNDLCLVLQFEEGDIRALFGGDISTDVEEQLSRREKWDKVLVFKADHHGSRYANAEALLKCIRPEITVASAGKDNRYGHPSPDAVQRIKESGSRFFCTIEGGRIRVRVIENKLVCETYVK